MAKQAHIFIPKNDSLSERIACYKSILEAFRNAQKSLEYLDNEYWNSVLGERQEVTEAFEIIQNSLSMAISSIKQSELTKAREQKLLSQEELKEFNQIKRSQEIYSFRNNQDNSDSDEFRLKR